MKVLSLGPPLLPCQTLKRCLLGLTMHRIWSIYCREKKLETTQKRGPIDKTETTCVSIYMSLSAFQNSCQSTKTKQCWKKFSSSKLSVKELQINSHHNPYSHQSVRDRHTDLRIGLFWKHMPFFNNNIPKHMLFSPQPFYLFCSSWLLIFFFLLDFSICFVNY